MIIASLIGIIISIIVLIYFFQIAADIRAIRQSIPMAYKVTLDGDPTRETIEIAERAVKMGNKDYARQILLLLKERLAAYDTDAYKAYIMQVDKLLSEL